MTGLGSVMCVQKNCNLASRLESDLPQICSDDLLEIYIYCQYRQGLSVALPVFWHLLPPISVDFGMCSLSMISGALLVKPFTRLF